MAVRAIRDLKLGTVQSLYASKMENPQMTVLASGTCTWWLAEEGLRLVLCYKYVVDCSKPSRRAKGA